MKSDGFTKAKYSLQMQTLISYSSTNTAKILMSIKSNDELPTESKYYKPEQIIESGKI